MALQLTKGSYIHEQITAATTWTVVHNLNSLEPAVDVVIDNAGTREKIIPAEINIVDANTISIVFSTAYAGTARVVA